MRIQAALLKEQGVKFGVVVVRRTAMNSDRQNAFHAAQGMFPGVPVVIMSQKVDGTPEYYGRHDLVRFLASVPLTSIPWREYAVA